MKTILCEHCGSPLPQKLAAKAHKNYQPRFCSHECHLAWRASTGWDKQWSATANAAQQRYASEHGEVPGYENRREALRQSNQVNPRRKKQERID